MNKMFIYFSGCLALSLALVACKKDLPTSPDDVTIKPGINSVVHVDSGNVGLVIDARKIFKRGYFPAIARVTFSNYARFDSSLPINRFTNIAVLSIRISQLSQAERNEFANGVAVTVEIKDSTQRVLTTFNDDRLVLNASNNPLSLTTTLPHLRSPLIIKEDIPYLLQPKDSNGVITSSCSDCFRVRSYINNSFTQQFYFTLVPGFGSNIYHIRHFGYTEGSYWYATSNGWINLRGGRVTGPPDEFVLEQDENGWVRIRHSVTGQYVCQEFGELRLKPTGCWFRLISDHINWQVEDHGTVYHQPIMPPVKLDFAYSATLRNCSSATLEESIGRTESRTRSTTIGTSESVALFSSHEASVGVTVGYEVKAKVGVDVEGIGEAGEEVTYSAQVNASYKYTTSNTRTSENTLSKESSETIEVSRIRTLTLSPYTAVEVYDAVKTVEGIRVPFTQVLRIRGTDSTGVSLTGAEIVTQMRFNFVTGTISNVGNNFVDISLRGYVEMDKIFKATTNVKELPGACN